MTKPIEPLSAEEIEERYQDARQYHGITKTTVLELCESHERLRAKLTTVPIPDGSGWLSMELVPLDGRPVLLRRLRNKPIVAEWDGEDWCPCDDPDSVIMDEPTGWLPVPPT